MKKTIYIVRHGETDFNKRGIVQGGGVDSDLNERGLQQADSLYRYYRNIPFQTVLTSKLKRTHQTMKPFIDDGIPWEQHADINEMNWGIHEGKESTEAMRKEYRTVLNSWKQGNYEARLQDGESANDLGFRVERFVRHLFQRPEEIILVCSHGRAMRGLICALRGLPWSEMQQFEHANTGLWLAHRNGETLHFTLENDTRHLEILGSLTNSIKS